MGVSASPRRSKGESELPHQLSPQYPFPTEKRSRGCHFKNFIFTILCPSPCFHTPNSPSMFPSLQKNSQPREQQQKQERGRLGVSFRPENFIPGLVVGFIIGLLFDLSKPGRNYSTKKTLSSGKLPSNGDQELKMVLVVRQDLKMKSGKIASQCAHAATGMYAELMYSSFSVAVWGAKGKEEGKGKGLVDVYYAIGWASSHRSLLRQWEQCGQPKIVVTCKNQQEMNRLKEAADNIGLPTFVVADAGRTQVTAGSKTVLAVGPGPKVYVDSVTGKLALL